jgi:signal peptidase II
VGVIAPLIVVAIVVVDQITKSWVVSALADDPLHIVGSDIEFRLARNSGGAFSSFQSATPVLAVLAIVLAFFLANAVRKAKERWLVVALSLVLGGALGNLVDRLARSPGFLRGEVVDFVKVYSFPSFNVADSCITIGAVMLVVGTLFSKPDADAPARS